MAIHKFGRGRFGRGFFGRGELPENEENKTFSSLMQRLPHGFAWRGKNLAAIMKTFAREFATLKLSALNKMHENRFLAEYAAKSIKYPSLSSVETQLHLLGFETARLFYVTGLREYVSPPNPTHTFFGAKQSRFGAKWSRFPNGANVAAKAQFGAKSFSGTNPRSFPQGGNIDYLLNKAETPDDEAVKVWEMLTDNRFFWRFIFYVGGTSSVFWRPINFDTQEQYTAFRRELLKIMPFGMMAIINRTIANENNSDENAVLIP